MHDFELVKPASVAEAVAALAAEGAQALSGGQTLLPSMKQRLAAPDRLVSLLDIPEMRGVCHGDRIPGNGSDTIPFDAEGAPAVTLDLGYMKLGDDAERGPSWLSRMTALRDRLGPFRLAYLETLLRVADMRASKEEAKRA